MAYIYSDDQTNTGQGPHNPVWLLGLNQPATKAGYVNLHEGCKTKDFKMILQFYSVRLVMSFTGTCTQSRPFLVVLLYEKNFDLQINPCRNKLRSLNMRRTLYEIHRDDILILNTFVRLFMGFIHFWGALLKTHRDCNFELDVQNNDSVIVILSEVELIFDHYSARVVTYLVKPALSKQLRENCVTRELTTLGLRNSA